MRRLKQYGLQLEDNVVSRIDRLAKKLNQPRSLVMRNLIMSGLNDAEVIQKSGIIDTVIFSNNIITKIKSALLKGRLILNENDELQIIK